MSNVNNIAYNTTLASLSQRQRIAVTCPAKYLQIVAGPDSGKTRGTSFSFFSFTRQWILTAS